MGMILAGDVGGTKTNLALFQDFNGRLLPVREERYVSKDAKSLEEIVAKFMAGRPEKIDAACFGIAGPVRKGRCETTNLAWIVDSGVLAHQLGLKTTTLINDLEANAYGIETLTPNDFLTLNEGAKDAEGNIAVVAAGTGLGEAGMYWDGKNQRPFATEGGHSDFAPRNELEVELWRFLQKEFGRVSYERVLSGPGLYNVYRFLRDTGRGKEEPWLAQAIQGSHPSSAVSQAALEGKSDLCVRALDLFIDIYGAEAGNFALKLMATGGVYIGGGIAPKNAPRFVTGRFMEAFLDKGRFRTLLSQIPVKVILNDKTALLGSARCAQVTMHRG